MHSHMVDVTVATTRKTATCAIQADVVAFRCHQRTTVWRLLHFTWSLGTLTESPPSHALFLAASGDVTAPIPHKNRRDKIRDSEHALAVFPCCAADTAADIQGGVGCVCEVNVSR
jgi:hypothetical protein